VRFKQWLEVYGTVPETIRGLVQGVKEASNERDVWEHTTALANYLKEQGHDMTFIFNMLEKDVPFLKTKSEYWSPNKQIVVDEKEWTFREFDEKVADLRLHPATPTWDNAVDSKFYEMVDTGTDSFLFYQLKDLNGKPLGPLERRLLFKTLDLI